MKLIKKYGLFEFFRLTANILLSKIIYSNEVRIIRQPAYIRGKNFIDFGKKITIGVGVRLDAFPTYSRSPPSIKFGDNVQLNDYVHIGAIKSVTIGNNVLIASKVFITDHNHGSYGNNDLHSSPETPPDKRELSSSPVIIEDNVWIGEFVSILPGVTIGKGSIIGAMTLVNKDIPPFSIAVGVPAKVIKKYDFEEKKWVKI